ncbi:hypothetical protein GCM10017667_66890 [Streptomyces filamentosus]|uniref:Uncharacterized protein n=1 Tax=Streptomyces filamentosus TaxID=67294 RepID=A0A919ESX5_STRFL|nr:hypothetical protein GCM10017667_66890 [Streptomyces filamentosus]
MSGLACRLWGTFGRMSLRSVDLRKEPMEAVLDKMLWDPEPAGLLGGALARMYGRPGF